MPGEGVRGGAHFVNPLFVRRFSPGTDGTGHHEVTEPSKTGSFEPVAERPGGMLTQFRFESAVAA